MEYKEIIFDITTGQVTERPYTEEEIAEVKLAEIELAEKIKLIAEREKIKASALAKLAALGLTEEEIATL